MVSAADTAATTTVRFRTAPNGDVASVAFADADPNRLAEAQPWREFRWYAGQKHYSGTYWSATESRHVVYESRLDLARLLLADFDRSVHRICAQPFLLVRESNGSEHKHIPDYDPVLRGIRTPRSWHSNILPGDHRPAISDVHRSWGTSKLLIRAERRRPMRLTDDGARVVAAIRACERTGRLQPLAVITATDSTGTSVVT